MRIKNLPAKEISEVNRGPLDKKPAKRMTANTRRSLKEEKEKELIFLCGHYEGIDQRVIDEIVTDEFSIGDYIVTGGELPAMVMIDSICRLIPGVLGKQESFEEESFSYSLLEYPHYTRPPEFKGDRKSVV